MKRYFKLILFVLIFQYAAAQKAVKIEVKDTLYKKPLNYPHTTISYLNLPSTVNFLEPVTFNGDTFLHKLHFKNVKLSGTLSFLDATFLEVANFNNMMVAKDANYQNVKFKAGVDFRESTFQGDVSFKYAEFAAGSLLSFVTFCKHVSFFGASFKHTNFLNLNFLSIKDSCNFSFINTILPDSISFSENNNFKPDIYFSQANFVDSSRFNYQKNTPKPILIYLYNSNIAKIHLDYIHFKLWLPDSTLIVYDKKRKVISLDEKFSIYEALLNNFKANGQTESYKLLDIEYQKFKWNNSWKGFLTWLPYWWWNFGYDKENIFLWTFLFLTLFTAFNYFFIYSLNKKIYPIDNIPNKNAWIKKWSVKDFGPRLWYSFMYTSSIFFTFSLKNEKIDFTEKRGVFYLFTVYIIGLICIAYMANFVLQK